MLNRIIPSSGEQLPAIGLGSWQTFDTDDRAGFPRLRQVLQMMHAAGGSLIDSSPMYGRSEQTIGDITSAMPEAGSFFYATKVWTKGKEQGIQQMQDSLRKMKRERMDLIQIHNLVDWKIHLRTLREWKEKGIVRYIGITHYTDDYHAELEKILRAEAIDFVQFNYSITARHAEERLLPACAELGVATLINRPLGEGKLFKPVHNKMLPGWAIEAGIDNWAAFFLRYILAHPAVTCVIPATADPSHATDNMGAGTGPLPGKDLLKKMVDYVQNL